jgi:hypothetical protein
MLVISNKRRMRMSARARTGSVWIGISTGSECLRVKVCILAPFETSLGLLFTCCGVGLS